MGWDGVRVRYVSLVQDYSVTRLDLNQQADIHQSQGDTYELMEQSFEACP